MAVTTRWYGAGLTKVLNKEVDIDSDALKIMGVTSSYTFSAAHDYKDDITNEIAGTGYTATGATLASVTCAYVAANSWAVARANTTAYAAGDVVRPATGNTFLYQAITGGTSGGSIPTYPTTIGGTVADGTVTWMCVASGGIVFDAADPSWTTATFTVRAFVVYDSTPATDATRPVLAFIDLGADVPVTASTFALTLDARGIAYLLVP